MQTPTRTDSTVELGQWLMGELLKQPVKDAVREALEEEGVGREQSSAQRTRQQRGESSTSQSERGESSGPSVTGLLVGLAVVGGVAYLLRKRTGSQDESSPQSQHSDSGKQTAVGDRTEAGSPVTSED